jgi:uncharacterized protein YigA (DUF484 family)
MADNTIRFKAVADSSFANVEKKLNGISKAFDKLGGPGSGASLFGNVGARAVSVGFGLISEAAGGVVNFLGDAVRASMEEQVSIAKLDQALKNNVPNWNGNRDAIEGVIKARMDLGFSDDEQRNSLALLLGATHDQTQALALQRTAMDLARLKGISLEEASNALIKVDGGQYRALKALGIVLPATATAEEALTAVRKVATGQADAYANTTAGKLTTAQVKIGEAMEKLGNVVLPLVSDALGVVADAADAVGSAIEGMTNHVDKSASQYANFGPKVVKLTDQELAAAKAFDRVGEGAAQMATDVGTATNRAANSVVNSVDREINAVQHEIDMLDNVKKANYRVAHEIPELEKKLAHAHGLEAQRIRDEIRLINLLAAKANIARAAVLFPGNQIANNSGRAAGGPVYAGEAYTVGENGPETLIMGNSGGKVIPTSGTGGGTTGAGGGFTIRGVSEREIVDMVDRGLFFRLQRASPTLSRT